MINSNCAGFITSPHAKSLHEIEIIKVENGFNVRFTDEKTLNKIKALIKETGFIAIPSESFSILDDVTDYQKSNVKITLNGRTNQVHWPEQNATANFIPPIITMVESELDKIILEISE